MPAGPRPTIGDEAHVQQETCALSHTDEILVDADAVARLFRLASRRTVYDLARRGVIPSIRLSPGILRFPLAKLRDLSGDSSPTESARADEVPFPASRECSSSAPATSRTRRSSVSDHEAAPSSTLDSRLKRIRGHGASR